MSYVDEDGRLRNNNRKMAVDNPDDIWFCEECEAEFGDYAEYKDHKHVDTSRWHGPGWAPHLNPAYWDDTKRLGDINA